MKSLATTAALAAIMLSSFALTAAPASAYSNGERVTRCEGERCACFHCDGYGCVRIGAWYFRGGSRGYGYGYGPHYRCDPVSNQCALFRDGVRISPWRPR